MNKKYVSPIIEIIDINKEDIIVTSEPTGKSVIDDLFDGKGGVKI